MFEGLGEVLKVFELKTKYFFAIWFVGVILLFAPDSWLARLGLTSFLESYRGWVGLIALIFLVLWGVSIFSDFRAYWKKKREEKQDKKELAEFKETALTRINSLSQGERFLPQYAVVKNYQVVYAHYTSRYAQGLVRKGLLTASGQVVVDNFSFGLS